MVRGLGAGPEVTVYVVGFTRDAVWRDAAVALTCDAERADSAFVRGDLLSVVATAANGDEASTVLCHG